MSVLDMTITGNTAVISNLDKMSAHVQEIVSEFIVKAVEGTYKDSQDAVPVDTGELKASGDYISGYTGKGYEGEISYGTDHCWYVELGTHKMAAQPYLLPAFLKWADWLKSELEGLF